MMAFGRFSRSLARRALPCLSGSRYGSSTSARETVLGAAHRAKVSALLLSAARFDEQTTVRELLAAGAAVNQADKHGWTALTVAATYGREAIAKQLVAAGAVVDVRALIAALQPSPSLYDDDWYYPLAPNRHHCSVVAGVWRCCCCRWSHAAPAHQSAAHRHPEPTHRGARVARIGPRQPGRLRAEAAHAAALCCRQLLVGQRRNLFGSRRRSGDQGRRCRCARRRWRHAVALCCAARQCGACGVAARRQGRHRAPTKRARRRFTSPRRFTGDRCRACR